jgi:hypothetical protein
MATPNEWDLIMGDDPQQQAQMLATMLRQRQALGDLVGLVGGKSFSPWGTAQSKMSGDALENLAQAAYHRRALQQQATQHQANQNYQQGMLGNQMAQLAESERQHRAGSEQARYTTDLHAQLEREKMANDLEKARILASARAGGANGKPLPNSVQTRLNDLDQGIATVEKALKYVEQVPHAFGSGQSWGSYFPNLAGIPKALNAIQTNTAKSPEQVEAHSFVMRQPAEEIKRIYGTAVTGREDVRSTFLPGETDAAAPITKKLNNLLWKMKSDKKVLFKQYGVNPASPRTWGAGGAVGPGRLQQDVPNIPPMLQIPGGGDLPNLGVHPIPPPGQHLRPQAAPMDELRDQVDDLYEMLLRQQGGE